MKIIVYFFTEDKKKGIPLIGRNKLVPVRAHSKSYLEPDESEATFKRQMEQIIDLLQPVLLVAKSSVGHVLTYKKKDVAFVADKKGVYRADTLLETLKNQPENF